MDDVNLRKKIEYAGIPGGSNGDNNGGTNVGSKYLHAGVLGSVGYISLAHSADYAFEFIHATFGIFGLMAGNTV